MIPVEGTWIAANPLTCGSSSSSAPPLRCWREFRVRLLVARDLRLMLHREADLVQALQQHPARAFGNGEALRYLATGQVSGDAAGLQVHVDSTGAGSEQPVGERFRDLN